MDTRKIIIFLIFLLITILSLFVFLNRLINSKKSTISLASPTPNVIIVNKNRIYPTRFIKNNLPLTPSLKDDNFYQEKILPQLNLFNQDEEIKFENLIKNTPINEENYSIFYSPLLNKVYFKPKNDQGKKEIKELLKNYQLEALMSKFPQNFIINETINQEKINLEENNFLENQQKGLFINNHELTPTFMVTPFSPTIFPSSSEKKENPFAPLVELLKILYQMQQVSETISPSPSIFLPQPSPSLPNNLTQLFNDVGQRVGVPVKILEGVLTIETPSTFNLTSDQITLYSQPGNRIDNCAPNPCSATGPMQMTIGIDDSGSTQCLKCGLTDCPNAWASYGRAVNIFTNDIHTPDPCNLRDNIFAAAYKLKTDSKATDPLNWTQEQVYEAGRRYYGSCADKYRYPRLGNRTYCEFLWWYYTNK